MNKFLLALIFLITNQLVSSQIVANDDSTNPINGLIGGYNQYSVLYNDTLNGTSSSIYSLVNLTVLSTTNAAISIYPDGSIYVPAGTASGTYFITYQICEISNPSNCDTAIITVSVCSIPDPTIAIINPDCSSSTRDVLISGLPSGNWTIRLRTSFGISYNYTNITGSGTSTTLSNLDYNNSYFITVIDNSGCYSQETLIPIYPYNMSLSGSGTYVDYNADGFVNVGDIVNFQFSLTNTGSCAIQNVQMIPDPNFTYFGGPIPSLMPGVTDNTTITGTRVLTQQNINYPDNFGLFNATADANGTLIGDGDLSINVPMGISDGIKLNAFIDTNSNGIQDGGEQNFEHGVFTYEMNNNGNIHSFYTNDGNHIIYESNPSNSYNLGYSVNQNITNSCIAQYNVTISSYSNITVANGTGITTYNFPITIVPCDDTAVYCIALGLPKPGQTYQNLIHLTNFGNQTIPSGTLQFNYDSILSISSISVAGTTSITNGFTYNFTNLVAGQSIDIIVTMLVPTIPNVNLGDLLTNTASISIPPTDSNATNNSNSLTQTIVGSYDPNIKLENHGGRIVHATFTSNDYLTYTIQFENTGTDNAINIKVNDVLDAKLDETSIRIVASSHEYSLERIGSSLTWKFNGINLPPSVPNTQTGHSYITFEIKPKTGYAIGDVIPNTAEIYFDFNPAIVTNTCTTEFVQTLGNENFVFANLNYYPNPVKNSLTISNNSLIESVEITSVLGQTMLLQKVNSLQTVIDMSTLSNGIYFVKVTSEGAEKTVKIVKE